MTRGLVTALRTLTILPIPGRDVERLETSVVWFPVVGALIGAAAAYTAWLVGILLPSVPLFAAVIALGVEVVLTGALHLDGAADVADGFGGGRGDVERALAIMKDPRCGSFGVVAIGVDIAVRIVLVGELIVLSRPDLVFWVIALSRAMQALTLTLFPSARTGGTAAPFLPSAGTKVVTMISVVLAAGVVFFLVPLVTASVVVASMILASLLWGGYCMLRIRGITGDCVGAANEISLAVGLAAAVLILQRSV